MLIESDDPEYYVKLPKELEDFTKKKNNNIVDQYDILTLFSEFKDYKFPKIFISFFDFSDTDAVKQIIKSFSKLNNEQILNVLSLAFMKAEDKRRTAFTF